MNLLARPRGKGQDETGQEEEPFPAEARMAIERVGLLVHDLAAHCQCQPPKGPMALPVIRPAHDGVEAAAQSGDVWGNVRQG